MTEQDLKNLRGHYHGLIGIKKQFDDAAAAKQTVIGADSVEVLANELSLFQMEFPNLIPPFNANTFFSSEGSNNTFYKLPGIRTYLSIAIGKIQVIIDSKVNSPVTEAREFAFVGDKDIRKVIERDYSELQRCFIAKCWKSVIILSGGAIEAILTDLLVKNDTLARAAVKAPKKADITKWDLIDLINVSVELKLVGPGVDKLSHSVREYRNLVHPGNEVRNHMVFDAEEAKIALEVLHILHRDLS